MNAVFCEMDVLAVM